ncbi:helix-turn-helix domain-containing protein [Frankia tisae]|uniref:helix-turn-helix domain-containing protein n=1 Tax=Frankia tisae TaxID=2950104 RepID=UPI0021BEDEDD|nr:helix-turn-helix transcriptional regulator [Frankia tisae]
MGACDDHSTIRQAWQPARSLSALVQRCDKEQTRWKRPAANQNRGLRVDDVMDMQPCLATLLESIVQRRKAAGLSQAQLANRVRYQPSYLSKAERGLLGVPSQSLIGAIDAELNAGGRLVELRRHAWLEDKGSRAGITWPRTLEEVVPTDRRQLIVGGSAATVGPAVGPEPPAPVSSPIGASRRAGGAIDLSGRWWTAWQTFRDGEEIHSAQEASLEQAGAKIHIEALTRGLSSEEGGYLWWGELQVFDEEIIMGWYVSSDSPVRSKGSLFLSLNPHGDRLTGRWVGLSYDGMFIEGWGAVARDEQTSLALIERLKKQYPKVA